MKNITEKAKHIKRLTLLQLGLLVITLWYGNAQNPSGFNFVAAIIQVAPFLILLPTLLSNNYRSYSWLCFVLLVYFIFAVQSVFMSNSTWDDALFLSLSISTFICGMYTSRWLQRISKNLTH